MRGTADSAEAPRARLAGDRHRPQYHFLPPANWMNDPNGLIQWLGQYHFFYQYNPLAAEWSRPSWGHAFSSDLVHWVDLPIALAPGTEGPDKDGCFSGCAVVHRGRPTLVYTGVWPEVCCLATSDDDLLMDWQKHPGNPVISGPPSGLRVAGFRDHSVWQEDGGLWYQAIGSGIEGVGGAVLLFRSLDLQRWEYLHPLYTGAQLPPGAPPAGTMWECPDFFPLKSEGLDGQQVLLFSAFDDASKTQLDPLWFSGLYTGLRFTPRSWGKLDHGTSMFYAPQSFLDERGRRIMFGWIREDRSRASQLAAGWAGLASLPRVLSLGTMGELLSGPAPELQNLRGVHFGLAGQAIPAGGGLMLEEVRGDALEIDVTFAAPPSAEPGIVGLCLCSSPGGEEQTLLTYDFGGGRLAIDRSRSSLDPEAGHEPQSGPLPLGPGEALRLHVFLDHSVLEVFANSGFCLTSRVYPTRPDSLGASLFALGAASIVEQLDVWEMGNIWR